MGTFIGLKKSHDEVILFDCLILWVDGSQPRENQSTWTPHSEIECSLKKVPGYTPFHLKYPKPFSGSTQSILCFLLPHFLGRKLIKS